MSQDYSFFKGELQKLAGKVVDIYFADAGIIIREFNHDIFKDTLKTLKNSHYYVIVTVTDSYFTYQRYNCRVGSTPMPSSKYSIPLDKILEMQHFEAVDPKSIIDVD